MSGPSLTRIGAPRAEVPRVGDGRASGPDQRSALSTPKMSFCVYT